MDNLLFADAKNCAFLKETVMDFLAENHDEAVKKVSFSDVPGHLMKDLLVAVGMSKREAKETKRRTTLTSCVSVNSGGNLVRWDWKSMAPVRR